METIISELTGKIITDFTALREGSDFVITFYMAKGGSYTLTHLYSYQVIIKGIEEHIVNSPILNATQSRVDKTSTFEIETIKGAIQIVFNGAKEFIKFKSNR